MNEIKYETNKIEQQEIDQKRWHVPNQRRKTRPLFCTAAVSSAISRENRTVEMKIQDPYRTGNGTLYRKQRHKQPGHFQQCSAESLFQTMGFDLPHLRRSNLSMDKYYQIVCSYIQTQLGLEINTRTMSVSLPTDKRDNLLNLLRHWHTQRKSFVIKEASSLLGKLNYAAEVAPWARFLFCAIRNSLLHLMRKNRQIVMNRSSFKELIIDASTTSQDNISLLRQKFALSRIAKAIWNSNKKCFINKSLREELNLLIDIITNPKVQWSIPIAHLITRTPDFQAWGDASLSASGGFSIDLGFYWYFQWPQSIQSKTLKFFKKRIKYNGEIISINLLEYIVVIINYAISSYLFTSRGLNTKYPHQSLLNWSDNRSAIAWTKQAAISTAGGKALSRIFCSLCINNGLQCSSHYINTKDNIIADDLSRIKFSSTPDFSSILQAHPALNSCRIFHLNPEFTSSMDKYYQIVCSYIQTQLSLEINTRTMSVSLPKD